MDKILIDVKCPMTFKTYDFWVSRKLLIQDAKKRIIEQITNVDGCTDLINEETVSLYKEDVDGLLCEQMTFEIAGVKSGDRLMLV
ncbi:MAG: hypothetical protein NC393_08535 [Clostridium sp.]|nr:hypothetical protein [Clostridium sp.]MCM1207705.1 hypothetical protein [Ruminococcus sp.]